MTDRTLATTLRAITIFGIVLALVGFVAIVMVAGPSRLMSQGNMVGVAAIIGFAAVVWIAAPHQPRNALLWVIAVFVLTMGTTPGTEAIVAHNAPHLALPLETSLIPAELPPIVAWTTGWSYAVSALGFFGMLTFGLLLFPNGRLPSRRWRWVAIALGIGLTLLSIIQILTWLPHLEVSPSETPLSSLSAPLVILGPPLSLASLVARYRSGDAAIRAQIRWIILGAAVMIPSVLVSIIAGIELLTTVGLTALALAYAISITRYRLFDVDLVISRTLVYASLAAFIGIVYVGLVVGLGALVGSSDQQNVVLRVGATALVAVAFQPVRRRLERLANRVVFGRRASPYEVLSDFSSRVAATSDRLVDDVARSLADGTRAERVRVVVDVDGHPVETAAWPAERLSGSTDISFPITDGGETLGALQLELTPGQHLEDTDRRLAEQLASGMGLALRNQVLTERLEKRVDELRESRRRLVAVQDETRRRLERDLHDGAQQQLVALKVKLGLGKAIAEKDGASETAEVLGRLSDEADAAVDAMREFARGVYPPLLEAEGLPAAIAAQARRSPIPVTVDTVGIGRYPREIESTVYFCVLEALRNTAQHAGAGRAAIRLTQSNGSLEFQVSDDGAGFDPHRTRRVGLAAMADRLDALTGELSIRTETGKGTVLTGTIPLSVEVPT